MRVSDSCMFMLGGMFGGVPDDNICKSVFPKDVYSGLCVKTSR